MALIQHRDSSLGVLEDMSLALALALTSRDKSQKYILVGQVKNPRANFEWSVPLTTYYCTRVTVNLRISAGSQLDAGSPINAGSLINAG